MSLNSILGAANSGLFAAQTQLKVVSDNIANVNTPGYVRETVQQQPVAGSDLAGGVSTGDITRSVDQFLNQANLSATAQSGSAGVISDTLDQAQALFGDPSESTGYFSQLEQTFADITAAVQNPSSSVPRDQVVNDISSFLDQSSSISSQLQQLGAQADSQISDSVGQVDNLLSQIDQLNKTIAAETASGGGAAGSQNNQAGLINQLSSLLDVKVSNRADGGVDIRSGDGSLLVGPGGPATLSYASSGATAGQLQITQPGGVARALTAGSGSLQGLISLRDSQLPAISSQLNQYVSQAVDQINRAHNAASAAPPPTQLTGANTGLDLPTAVSGFTGQTTIAIVNSSGVMQSRIDVDFGAKTMTVDGASPPLSFNASSFLGALNTALGSNGSASFSNGALSIQATGSNGVAIADNPVDPTNKAGRGFSDFFGLNNLITSTGFPNPDTGLKGTNPNGFTAGGVISLRLQNASGATLRLASVSVPAGGDMNSLVAALNSGSSGVGAYGAYSLDADGALAFTPSQAGVSANVVGDTTQRGAGGPSVSQLFGLPAANQTPLAQSYSVRSDIAADSSKLAMAQLDLSAVAGQSALSVGDSRGGQLLAAVNQQVVQFNAAGAAGSVSTTLSNYAAQFAGSIAQQASSADTNSTNAQSISSEATTRLSSVEGVSLDQELINLTTYQQAYNASARLLQAVSQLYTTLMQIQ
ncbi:MAG TPA: flagellar hook-associated protein FlgK [Caulobacteraceae bacterium]